MKTHRSWVGRPSPSEKPTEVLLGGMVGHEKEKQKTLEITGRPPGILKQDFFPRFPQGESGRGNRNRGRICNES